MSVTSSRYKLGPGRRGLASVSLLIGLLIIGLISFGLIRLGLARRGEAMAEERRAQAGWLAQSGLARASARLAISEDYQGETWEIPSGDLGGRGVGLVRIRVKPTADRPMSRDVHVEADYPSGSTFRARESKDIIMEIIPQPR